MGYEPRNELSPTLERVRSIVEQDLIPLEGALLADADVDVADVCEEVRQKIKREGLWAPHLSKSLGGMGLSLVDFAHVSEILGRTLVGHFSFNCQAPDIGNMEILESHASAEQKERFLHPLIDGSIRSCFAMTEPMHAGSNPVWMSTTARIEGDEYVIDGRKWFTTGADGAAFAIVMAVTDPEAPSYARASQIIVPTDTTGYRMVRNLVVMGHPGKGWASHAEVEFNGCRVPVKNRLGPAGAGFKIAQERLGPGRIHHCMRWIGICERAFDMMLARAKERELSPGKALGSQQIVQVWIAESRAEIDAARLMVLDTAERIEANGAEAARDSISTIKFYVAGVLNRVLDRAVQTHGAYGMTDETPLAFWYRQERAARIYDGPDEVHKIAVAKRLLKR